MPAEVWDRLVLARARTPAIVNERNEGDQGRPGPRLDGGCGNPGCTACYSHPQAVSRSAPALRLLRELMGKKLLDFDRHSIKFRSRTLDDVVYYATALGVIEVVHPRWRAQMGLQVKSPQVAASFDPFQLAALYAVALWQDELEMAAIACGEAGDLLRCHATRMAAGCRCDPWYSCSCGKNLGLT